MFSLYFMSSQTLSISLPTQLPQHKQTWKRAERTQSKACLAEGLYINTLSSDQSKSIYISYLLFNDKILRMLTSYYKKVFKMLNNLNEINNSTNNLAWMFTSMSRDHPN